MSKEISKDFGKSIRSRLLNVAKSDVSTDKVETLLGRSKEIEHGSE